MDDMYPWQRWESDPDYPWNKWRADDEPPAHAIKSSTVTYFGLLCEPAGCWTTTTIVVESAS